MTMIPVITQSSAPNQQGGNFDGLRTLMAGGAGAAAGYGAGELAHEWRSTSRNAKVGMVGTIINSAMGLLTSNASIGPANAAMQAANAVTELPGAFAGPDITNLKHGVQQLAAAVQQLTWGGYTGVSNLTPVVASPSAAVAPATSSIGTALIVGAGIVGVIYLLDT